MGAACLARTVCAVVAFSLAAAAAAQEPRRLRFERLGAEQGLSQSIVTAVARDGEGFLWVGTQEGLNRYDGYRFRAFLDRGEPGDLSHDQINALLADSRGRLWIGTEGGLHFWDASAGSFVGFQLQEAGVSSGRGPSIQSLHEVAPDRLWVGTEERGLFEVDLATASVRPVQIDLASMPPIVAMAVRRDGVIWIGTYGSGLLQGTLDGTVRPLVSPSPEFLSVTRLIRTLQIGRGGELWIGGDEGGLVRLQPDLSWDQPLRTARALGRSIHSAAGLESVRSLHLDSLGTLWVGTDAGVVLLPGDEPARSLRHVSSDASTIPGDRVNVVFESDGGVWVGTYGGLARWSRRAPVFELYLPGEGDGFLSHDNVTVFAEDAGAIWIGTFGGGLDRFDRAAGTFTNFRHDPGDTSSLPEDRVSSLLVDSRGTLWVGTMARGLARRDPGAGGFVRYRHDPGSDTGIGADGVTTLTEGPDGGIWVGSFGYGVSRLDPSTGTTRRYDTGEGLASGQVLDLLTDRDGVLWMATVGGGLHRFRGEQDRFEPIRHDAANRASLSSDLTWHLHEDDQGDLWISTQDAGVNRWSLLDRRQGRARFARFTEASGLPSQLIYGVLHDDHSGLWMSSNRGLVRMDRGSGLVTYYDETHGLQGLEFNDAALLRSEDGRLWFGGVNGFNVLDPEQDRSTRKRRLVVSRVQINGEEVEPGRWRNGLALRHDDVMVVVEVGSLDFDTPAPGGLQHRLVGLDSSWVRSTGREIGYTNLDPGRYTLEILASDSSDRAAALRLEIAVQSPPWATPLARLAYVILALLLLALLERGRRRRRRAAAALEQAHEDLLAEVAVRQKKEVQIDAERERAQQYFDVAEVALIVLDGGQRVLRANTRAEQLFAVPAEQLVGARLAEGWVHEEDRSSFRERLDGALQGTPASFESRLLASDGNERVVSWQAAPLPLPKSIEPEAAVLLSGADVTTAHWLADARQRAESANRAKSQFLANMSHEIRTPIGGVLGMLDLLSTSELGEIQVQQVKTAQQAAHGLLDLVNNVLDFSKIEAGHLELEEIDFDLQEVLDEVRAVVARQVEDKGIRLECRVGGSVPQRVLGDRTRLRQVLSNLIGNAVKFTEEGEVTVEVGAGEREGWLRFEVCDTGIGMSDPARERIFDAFHQADGTTTRLYGGSGLGLAITRQLVELMGGSIVVASMVGVGSRFSFGIPLPTAGNDPVPRERSAEAFASPPPLDGFEVLIVEDNAVVQQVVAGMVAVWGGTPTICADGREAITQASKRSWNLVLMDCQLPGVDGLEATVRIREHERENSLDPVPILAMTANAMAGDRERCLAAGMDDYVSKPFTSSQLLQAVQRVLSGSGDPVASTDDRIGEADAEAAQATELHLDPIALDDLFGSSDDGSARVVLEEFVRHYLTSTEDLITRLGQEVGSDDRQSLRRTAHTLRGSSAMVGAKTLVELCNRLEAWGEAGGVFEGASGPAGRGGAEAEAVVQSIRDEWTLVEHELRARLTV